MPSRRAHVLSAVALAATLSLTACANPLDQIVGGGGIPVPSGDGSQVDYSTDDGKVSVGTSVDLPESFPSDVPVPHGTLTAAVVVENYWTLNVEGVDEGALDALVAEITGLGYEKVLDSAAQQTRTFAFSGDAWQITILWDASTTPTTLIYGVMAASN